MIKISIFWIINWFNFIRLVGTIYGPKLPDIAFIESLGLLAVKIGQTYALLLDAWIISIIAWDCGGSDSMPIED